MNALQLLSKLFAIEMQLSSS